jgi:flagellar motor switch protein FliN/FliY
VGAVVLLAVTADPDATAPARPASAAARRNGLELLRDVEMELTVELGRTRMTVRELLALAPGAVVELDRAAGSPADLLVNGRLIARGEIVVVDEDFAVRITEILGPNGESEAAPADDSGQ